MIPKMDHEDLKEIGVKTFGQRFKIVAAGKTLNSIFGTKEDTIVEVGPTYSNEPVLADEIPDNFSITNILAANLPYERTYSSTKVKNVPRKSKELVISNLEDYCSGDRSEMLTVLEYMNFTEPIFRDSTFSMEQTNNNIDIDENVLDPPLMESTCLDL